MAGHRLQYDGRPDPLRRRGDPRLRTLRADGAAVCAHLSAQTLEHRVIVVRQRLAPTTTPSGSRASWPAVRWSAPSDEPLASPRRATAAWRRARARWWCCSTTTSMPAPDFLERLVAPLQDEPAVGSVACADAAAGRAADRQRRARRRRDARGAFRACRACRVERRPAASGRCWPVRRATAAAYRRSAWEQVGGLDEAIFAYMEDFDLALRLRGAGWETVAGRRRGRGAPGLGHARAPLGLAAPPRGLRARLHAAPLRRAARAPAPRALATETVVAVGGRADLARPGGPVGARGGLAPQPPRPAAPQSARGGDGRRDRDARLAGPASRRLRAPRARPGRRRAGRRRAVSGEPAGPLSAVRSRSAGACYAARARTRAAAAPARFPERS